MSPRNPSSADDQAPMGMTARDVLYVGFRHKYKMAATFLLVSAVGLFAVYSLTDIYESQGSLLVKIGRGALVRGDTEIRLPDGTIAGPAATELSSIMTMIQSPIIAEEVVDIVGVEDILSKPDPPPVVRKVKGWIDAILPGSDKDVTPPPMEIMRTYVAGAILSELELRERGAVIQASFSHPDPKVAQRTLQAIFDVYMARHVDAHRSAAGPKFFEGEAKKAREVFTSKTAELEALRKKHDINDVDSQLLGLAAAIRTTEESLRDADAEISAAKARIQAYRKQLTELVSAPVDGSTTGAVPEVRSPPPAPRPARPEPPIIGQLKRELVDLRVQESALARKYQDGMAPLEDVRDQIRIKEEALKAELAAFNVTATTTTEAVVTTNVVAPPRQTDSPDTRQEGLEAVLGTEEAQLTGLVASRGVLDSDLTRLKGQETKLRGVETEVKRLERERTLLEESYLEAMRNLERSKIAQALDSESITNVQIYQPPTFNIEPSAPNKTRNYALVLFAAIMASLGLAIGCEYLNTTFRTKEEVERHLDVPVLASIPESELRTAKR